MNPENPPDNLKYAAIAQIAGGAVDMLFGWWIAMTMWTMFGSIFGSILVACTGGICFIGACLPALGFAGFLIIPASLMQIVAGVVGMVNPKGGAMFMKIAAGLGLLALPLGGLGTAIGSGVSLYFQTRPEVKAYLESPEPPKF